MTLLEAFLSPLTMPVYEDTRVPLTRPWQRPSEYDPGDEDPHPDPCDEPVLCVQIDGRLHFHPQRLELVIRSLKAAGINTVLHRRGPR